MTENERDATVPEKQWSAEEAASGHAFRPGKASFPVYCVRCGCADFVHDVWPAT